MAWVPIPADLISDDKVTAIRALSAQGGVMMVGDGINDAPAPALANVGVAMESGTDVMLETADAALLRNWLTDIPALIRLAQGAMANINQNVTIALGLKAVFLVTTVLGGDLPVACHHGRHRSHGSGHAQRTAAVAL